MSTKKPPNNNRNKIQQRIKEILNELRKPQFFQDSFVPIYNDFLILRSLVPNLPKQLYQQLLLQLNHLHIIIKSWVPENSKRELSLHRIMKILEKTQEPDYMLEDFLVCSGYSKKLLK